MTQDPTPGTRNPHLLSRAALIIHNVVPLRAEPAGASEQVSQAILGDPVILLAERDDYVRVRMADGYEGWIWRGHLRPGLASAVDGAGPWPLRIQSLPEGAPQQIRYVSAGIADLCDRPGETETLVTKLVLGAWLRVIGEARVGSLSFLKVEAPYGAPEESETAMTVGYVAAGDTLSASGNGYQGEFSGKAACALALRFIGTPYLWGGTTPFGFDCSGFVQRIYSMLNTPLPRDAYLQARYPLGAQLTGDQTLCAGDLVFFCGRSDPRKRGITHVGMALDAERFIHAYGKRGVVITPFDDPACRAVYTYVCAWRYRAGENSSLSLASAFDKTQPRLV